MSRELKRVPLDFSWSTHTTGKGYLCKYNLLDFSALSDPVRIAEARRERERESLAIERQTALQKKAARVCEENLESLSEVERSFVRSAQRTLNSYLVLSDKQLAWLFRLARRFEPVGRPS